MTFNAEKNKYIFFSLKIIVFGDNGNTEKTVQGYPKSDEEEMQTYQIMLIRFYNIYVQEKNNISEMRKLNETRANEMYHVNCRMRKQF